MFIRRLNHKQLRKKAHQMGLQAYGKGVTDDSLRYQLCRLAKIESMDFWKSLAFMNRTELRLACLNKNIIGVAADEWSPRMRSRLAINVRKRLVCSRFPEEKVPYSSECLVHR